LTSAEEGPDAEEAIGGATGGEAADEDAGPLVQDIAIDERRLAEVKPLHGTDPFVPVFHRFRVGDRLEAFVECASEEVFR